MKYRVIVDVLLGSRERPKRGWKTGVFEVKGTEIRKTKFGNELHFCFSDCPTSIRGRGGNKIFSLNFMLRGVDEILSTYFNLG